MSEDKNSFLESHLQFAKNANHRTWHLLEKSDRSAAENEEMLASAFASFWHWKQAGTAVNTQRAYWLLSRVHLALDRADDALNWAVKCLESTENNPAEMEDFDLAFAHEGLARACALAGDLDRAQVIYTRAVELGNRIKDPEDQEIFFKDLKGGDWFQFSPE